MVHPRCNTIACPFDIECVKVLWRSVSVDSVLIYSGSLVLGDWILEPLPQLEAGADGDGLAIIFVQVS
jgi:hypothetical protein